MVVVSVVAKPRGGRRKKTAALDLIEQTFVRALREGGEAEIRRATLRLSALFTVLLIEAEQDGRARVELARFCGCAAVALAEYDGVELRLTAQALRAAAAAAAA